MKKIYLLIASALVGTAISAQATLTIKGAVTGTPTLYIKNGASVYVKGGITIDQNGSPVGANGDYLQNNGVVTIASDSVAGQSDLINNVSGLVTYTGGQNTGEVVFAANNETQAISGSGTATFMKLTTASIQSPTLDLLQDVSVNRDFTIGGATVKINATKLTLNWTLAGTGTFTGGNASKLYINGSGNLGSPLTFENGYGTLQKFVINRANTTGHTILLNSDLAVNDTLSILNGIVNIQQYNLGIQTGGKLHGAPFSVNNMIQADSTGMFTCDVFAGAGTYLYPIGDGTPAYTPATLTMISNANGGNVGVNVTNRTHPSMFNPTAPTSYLKRYWSFRNNLFTGNYSYDVKFEYLPGDVVGNEAGIKLNWYFSSWHPHPASIAQSNILMSTTPIPINNFSLTGDFTGRSADCLVAAGSISAAQDTICEGGTQALKVNGNNGNLQWQSSTNGIDFSNINSATDSTYSAQASQTTYYRVYATNGGCADTSLAFALTVNPEPATPVVSLTDAIICAGDSTLVCATDGYASYLWNNGDTAQCFYAKSAGGYWVAATDIHGCTSKTSVHKQLNVYPSPSVSIIVRGDTLSSFGAVSYQWYRNDTAIPGATSSFYIVKETGDYKVRTTDANGCNSMSANIHIDFDPRGIEEAEIEKEVLLYPNPARDEVVIYMKNGKTLSEIRLIDMLGREIEHKPMMGVEYGVVKMDVSDLPAGMFRLMLYSKGQYLGSKVMIHQAAE